MARGVTRFFVSETFEVPQGKDEGSTDAHECHILSCCALTPQNPANPYQHFYFHSGQLWVVSNLLEPLLRHGEEIDRGRKKPVGKKKTGFPKFPLPNFVNPKLS